MVLRNDLALTAQIGNTRIERSSRASPRSLSPI
jgi:hypothetical protein